jgi:acyl carrier protein
MKKKDLIKEISEILIIDVKEVEGETDLTEIGWDSLTNLAFMSFVDSKFNIIISPKDLNEAKKVSDILKLVSSHLED